MLTRAVEQPALQPVRIKVDPGSKTTGIALVNDESSEVVWAAELTQRGEQIKPDLDKRRAARRNRRQRKTRYRAPRFQNRRNGKGTLPPSLESRICNVVTWVCRLMRLCPISAISQELVRFDTQVLEYPDTVYPSLRRFDEATSPEVTMTESHTRCASGGRIRKWGQLDCNGDLYQVLTKCAKVN